MLRGSLGLMAGLLIAPAFAGVGGSVIPSFPANLQVGDIRTATITITNGSTTPNNTENVNVSGIFLTPSCAASDGFSCTSADAGVFQFGTTIGAAGSSCAGIPFTRGAPDLNGEFELIPQQQVVLGPSNNAGPLPRRCVISINFQVVRAPIDSTPPNPPLTTDSLAHANLQGVVSGNAGAAAGGSQSVITPVAGLIISKTDGQTTVLPNTNTIYTVTVQNNGPSEVTNATVVDTAPAGVTFTSWTCAVTNPGAGGTVTTACGAANGMGDINTTATLKVGGVVTYTITALVTANSGSITNTASVTPPVGTNNTAAGCVSSGGITRNYSAPTCSSSDTDTVQAVADLVITKTDGVLSVNAGASTTYTVTVTNNGPSTVTGAILSDPVVTGLNKTAVACSAAPGQCVTPPTIAELESGTFALPQLASGQTYQIAVTATATATSGSVTNDASIAPPAGTINPGTSCTAQMAPNARVFAAGVCTASDTDTVTPVSDLVITKTNGVTGTNAGTSTTYTVTVTNNGPSPVTGAILSDPVATGLNKTAVACSVTPGQCVTPPTIAELESGTFALPLLNSGQTYQITVIATVTAASGTVTNAASVAPPVGTVNPGTSCTTQMAPNARTFTPGTGTCTASDTDNVSAVADLSVTKTDGVLGYTPSGALIYTIVVTNNGPSPAVNAVVTDPKPAQYTTWTWACTTQVNASDCTPQAAGTSNFSDTVTIQSGGSITYTVTATVSAAATTDIVNTVTVTPAAGTTNPGTTCTTQPAPNARTFTVGTGACAASDTDILALGIGGGHFDFDIYDFVSGKFKKLKHVHEYDNEWGVTGVNMLAPSDPGFNLSVAIPSTATTFKVLVMNQYLNPAGQMAVGPGNTEVSVKTYGGLAGPSTDIAALLAALPTYSRSTPDMRLIVNFPITAFNTFDWWGEGDPPRAGVIPTQTGCVNGVNDNGSSKTPGPQGERANGALTIQIIDSATLASELEMNVAGDPRYGWRVKLANMPTRVLAEYTVFWHHPNGECYGDAGWVPNPPLDDEDSGDPADRPSGSADPTGPIPPNPTPVP